MIKIIIADDHQMFIDGIKLLLKPRKDIEVIAEANNGLQVLETLKKQAAHLVLMDINMPEMNGEEATKEVKKQFPQTKVLMLTMFSTREYIEKLLRAGADGYILKNTGKEELSAAIDTIMAGQSFYSKAVTERIMEGLQKKKQTETDPLFIELTQREKEVLQLIVQELTSHEIADKLCISFHTVETHRKNLISKLQVKNIAGLVKFALQHGLAE